MSANGAVDDHADPGVSRGGRTRARILDAALDALATSGYHGTTLGDIAAAAGLTRTGLLHHFAGKDELVIAALDHRNLRNARATHVLTAEDPEALFAAILQMVELNVWAPDLIRAYTILSGESVASNHPAHRWFDAHYEATRRSITTILERGVRTGSLRPGTDPGAVAAQLVALMDGLQIQWLHAPESVDLPAVMADAVARIQRDLTVPPAP